MAVAPAELEDVAEFFEFGSGDEPREDLEEIVSRELGAAADRGANLVASREGCVVLVEGGALLLAATAAAAVVAVVDIVARRRDIVSELTELLPNLVTGGVGRHCWIDRPSVFFFLQ